MEKTSEHGVLGRHQSCSEERIEVVSESIERHHSSRNTPSLLYSESCCGIWRSFSRKENVSPWLPPKSSFGDDWMYELDLEVAGSSKDSQRIQPKLETQFSRTERPREWATIRFVQSGDRKRCLVWSRRHQKLKNGGTCGRTTIPSELCASVYEDKDEDADADQTRKVRPVGGQKSTQLEEINIDFRVPGLSHAVVKEAENFRVRELVKKIASHPHRVALQADLQQNNVYNSLSNNSKAIFELCETIPKVQCSQCLLCWNQGVIIRWKRIFCKRRLDALFIQHNVIKKGATWCSTRQDRSTKRRPHGLECVKEML